MKTIRQNATRRHHSKATIGDVARRAGVSPMTVSRVINGEMSVRPGTRESVRTAIRELGYSPNRAARSLASANQIQIGVLYTNPSATYLSAMLLGALEKARESDLQLVVVECDADAGAVAAIRSMIRGGIDGILLPPPLAETASVLRLLKQRDVPAVTIGTPGIEEGIPSIGIDDYAAASAMTRHIISLGHKRIGFITGSPDQLASELRLSGFRDAMQQAGIEVADELIVPGRFSYRSGLEAAERLLGLADAPTAIFASNDDMAAATIVSAHRHDVDVPGGLTVCGFDDTLLATAIWPQITTIQQPIGEMSRTAVELLERNINARRAGAPAAGSKLTLEFRLIERDSAAPPSRSS